MLKLNQSIFGEIKNDSGSDYPKNYLVRMIRSLDNRYQTYAASRGELFMKLQNVQKFRHCEKNALSVMNAFYKDFEQILSK